MQAILEARGVSKAFLGVQALQDVDFRLFPGEVHALLGENGAGKSTLVKVLTGVHTPSSGSLLLGGQEIDPKSPGQAQELGISSVYQEVNLVPNLSVAENIFLGRQPRRFGLLDYRTMNRQARELLETFKLAIDVSTPLSRHSVAVQQLVAIARGVSLSAKVLILDEPTASLDASEVNTLFEVMRTLTKQGLAILFITHFLDQVYAISDRITVLRNGRKVIEKPASELSQLQLVSAMLGRELSQTLSEAAPENRDRVPFLEVRGFTKRGVLEPFDLKVSQGEIVGLAGLLGSGRTELAQLVYGVTRSDAGAATVRGKPVRLNSPRQAMAQGFGMCPEDRKVEGIVGELTIRENIILALQSKRGLLNPLSLAEQNRIAGALIRSLRIATPDAEKPVRELSGGNQQKVILARWLAAKPTLLIVDEPTRGIDVGAHAEIITIMKELCAEGMALLIISSELGEIVEYSDRVMVLRDRRVVRELTGSQVTEDAIISAIAVEA